MNILKFGRNIVDDWRYLVPFTKRLGYIGWLGYDNLGDETMYLAFQKLFSEMTVLPFKRSKKIDVMERAKLLKSYESVVLGGGSLINSNKYLEIVKIAQECCAKSFVFGTGVRNPDFWTGRLKSGDPKLQEWTQWLHRCHFVGVRGPLSKQMLQNQDFNRAQVVGDLAFLLAEETIQPKAKNKRVGINIGTDGQLWGTEENVLDFVVSLSKILQDKGYKITLLPAWTKNIPYIAEAAKRIGNGIEIFKNYHSLSDVMAFLKSCDFFIGEKLHSVVLASCVYTPAIMLAYRTKCLDVMAALDLQEQCMKTDQLSIDKAVDLINTFEKQTEIYQLKVKDKMDFYKKTLENAKREIMRVIAGQN